MRRKKAAKTVKTKKTKRSRAKKQSSTMNSTDKMEKQFREIPGQLATQCRKDLATFSKQESRLSKELKKALSLSKAISAKCDNLTNANPTATVKKQLASAKKGYKKANDAIAAISAKFQQITQTIENLTDKQNKYLAIEKELNQFDKNWSKKSVKPVKKKQKNTAADNQSDASEESHENISTMQEEHMNEMSTHESMDMDA